MDLAVTFRRGAGLAFAFVFVFAFGLATGLAFGLRFAIGEVISFSYSSEICSQTGLILITTDFEAGVLLFSATLLIGTSTFASGKYVAAQRRGMS